ncbi:MAG: Glycerophosphoryl diester phosphodiesterase [uncultured Chloroflexi bacterium]|uniref:Glycerophosphoryl diester phosphodiesterase n=1 Tax=uncultured Chloroflexota bacterium TaxID=166587 RepID=A0A6J4IM44_9CHLR|nr:MAG: Glycerophosphoryl diester phosphodiesterase [uncultured Chloroflexota bacterium]
MLLFGHRGARGEAPENTLAGFRHARGVGVAAFELDVRLTADDKLAVIHDATVDRTTNESGPVSDFTAAQLAELDARANHPEWPERVGVPLLSEVLDGFADQVRFAIEIKTDAPERLELVCAAVVAHIERYAVAETVAVTSFDPVALEIMRRIAPALPRAFIGAFDTPAFLETALRLECRQADVQLSRGSAEVVRQAQSHGLRVVGWQGNTTENLAALIEWGVDGITSDYPTQALAYLREHGKTATAWGHDEALK